MKTFAQLAVAATLACTIGAALAQPGPGAGAAPGAAASAPGPMGSGPHRGGRWGKDFTPGWGLMTAEERRQHQDKMRGMTSYDDCRGYMDQHHQQMADRAKEKGRSMPAKPRRDACAALKR